MRKSPEETLVVLEGGHSAISIWGARWGEHSMPSLGDLPTGQVVDPAPASWQCSMLRAGGGWPGCTAAPGSILLLWGDPMVTSALGPDSWGPVPPMPAVTLRWPVISNQLHRPCGRRMTQLDNAACEPMPGNFLRGWLLHLETQGY